MLFNSQGSSSYLARGGSELHRAAHTLKMLFAMGSIGTSQPSNSTFLYMDPNTGNSTGRFYCLFRQLFSCVTNRVRLSSLVIVWKTLTIIVIQKNCLVACCDPGIFAFLGNPTLFRFRTLFMRCSFLPIIQSFFTRRNRTFLS